jgi:hypothetical protein
MIVRYRMPDMSKCPDNMPGKWTEKWDEFIENNPNASASDVYRFGGKLMDEYGLSHFELGPY